MCGLEVPDLFHQIRTEFGADEVDLYGVNFGEDRQTVDAFIVDTGMREAVMLDAASEANGCRQVPDNAGSVYEVFNERVGHPELGPFPLHVIIDTDGNIAYHNRFHRPEEAMIALRSLVGD